MYARAEDTDTPYLVQLGDKLHDPDTRRVLLTGSQQEHSVSGMGGVGKTTLAAAYYHISKTHHLYDVLIWLTFESKKQLVQAYERFLDQVQHYYDSSSEEGILNGLKNYLSDKKYLLVIDNSKCPAELRDPPGYLPGGQGHTLITSRVCDPSWAGLSLGVFQESDALSFLYKLTGYQETDETRLSAQLLVKKLGNLPLAIEQASKYILKEGISFDEYMNRYNTKARELLSYSKSCGVNTVHASFEVTRVALIPLSGLLLQCMSYMAPEDIPLTVLRGIMKELPLGKDVFDASLEELEEYSLIKRSSNLNYASIHRLVQKFGRLREKAAGRDVAVKEMLERVIRGYITQERAILQLDTKKLQDIEELVNNVGHMTILIKRYAEMRPHAEQYRKQFIPLYVVVLAELYAVFEMNPLKSYKKYERQNFTERKMLQIIQYSNAEIATWADAHCDDLSPSAQHGVGLLFLGTDSWKEFYWFRKAAEQGFAPAQFALGMMYRHLELHWFRKAAEQGFAPAQFALGMMYETGSGVVRETAQAVHWFTKAAEQGFAPAQCNLGVQYAYGYGVEKDYTQAAHWFTKAAEQGDYDADYNHSKMRDFQEKNVDDLFGSVLIGLSYSKLPGNANSKYLLKFMGR